MSTINITTDAQQVFGILIESRDTATIRLNTCNEILGRLYTEDNDDPFFGLTELEKEIITDGVFKERHATEINRNKLQEGIDSCTLAAQTMTLMDAIRKLKEGIDPEKLPALIRVLDDMGPIILALAKAAGLGVSERKKV